MRLTEGVVRGQELSSNHELQAGHDHIASSCPGQRAETSQRREAHAPPPAHPSEGARTRHCSYCRLVRIGRNEGKSEQKPGDESKAIHNRILVLLGHDVNALCLVSGDG